MNHSGEKTEVLELRRNKNNCINAPAHMENMPLIYLLKVSA
jgi:hypothetical protein